MLNCNRLSQSHCPLADCINSLHNQVNSVSIHKEKAGKRKPFLNLPWTSSHICSNLSSRAYKQGITHILRNSWLQLLPLFNKLSFISSFGTLTGLWGRKVSEKVLSVTASSGYHQDSITHVKSIMHLFCTSLKTPDIIFCCISTSVLSLETLYFWQLDIWAVVHLFSTW